MTRKLYSIPAIGVDGTHVGLVVVMSPEQADLIETR